MLVPIDPRGARPSLPVRGRDQRRMIRPEVHSADRPEAIRPPGRQASRSNRSTGPDLHRSIPLAMKVKVLTVLPPLSALSPTVQLEGTALSPQGYRQDATPAPRVTEGRCHTSPKPPTR